MLWILFWIVVLVWALTALLRSTRGTSSPRRRTVRGRPFAEWTDGR